MSRSTVRITPYTEQPTDATLQWVHPDGSIEFEFDTMDLPDAIRASALFYGIKQILADGGAVGRDIPAAERIAKMDKRARALRDGTWAFRDGHGTPKAETDSATMYAALVAVGAFADNAAARETWKAAKQRERAALFYGNPEAVAHAAAAKPAAPSAADLLARLQKAA